MTAALAIRPDDKGLLVPDFTPEYVLTLDFETYWDQDYSLTKLGTSDYVRNPLFETIGVGVNDGEEKTWMEADEFRAWVKTVPWEKTAVKAHHAHFEGLILSHHYDVHPAFFFCTLSMARTFGLQDGRGLDDLGRHFGVGDKVKGALEDAKGKRRKDFTYEEWLRFGQYCLNDIELTDGIFDAMLEAEEGFPESELWVIHEHVMMFTRPRLFLDVPLLVDYLKDEKARKQGLLDRVAKDRRLITSDKLFINELQLAGLDSIPMKPSPKRKDAKGEPLLIPAFSKNDPGMQELLEHESDPIRWLAETRLAMKSTINETRTERFLKSALVNGGEVVQMLRELRGSAIDLGFLYTQMRPVPVYLNYYGAHTGRASGSDKRNWQNLERTNKKNPKKGVLRKAALAPQRMKVTAADSGAIEARVTSWLAGHDELIEAFAAGRDVYSEFMSQVLNRPVDRKRNPEDEIPGFIGKICLAGETPTLTEHRGWVRLDRVCQTDRVWDGVEWVNHQGLLDQGVKQVVESKGLAATPDHDVLTAHGWKAWSEVLTSPSLFQSALSLANSPSLIGSPEAQAGTLVSGALAAGKEKFTEVTSSAAEALAALHALRRRQAGSDGGSTKMLSLMMRLASGFSTVDQPSSLAATIRRTVSFITTAVEAFRSALSGVLIPSPSFITSFNFQGGTEQNSISIGSTTIAGTSLGTFGSSHVPPTARTSDTLPTWKTSSDVSVRKTRVYDLLSAGPRKRFCVLTSDGPIIVSNCVLGLGYQMGWPKLAENFLKGAMNGPPVKFDWEMAQQLGADISKFTVDEWKMEKVNQMITRVPKEELVIHCAVTEVIVKKWRALNKPIVELWKTMEHVIEAMCEDDADYTFGPNECLRVVRHAIVLPNGMRLRYPGLRYIDGYSYLGEYGKMRKHLYGGKLTENVVQALARIVVTDQMLHVKAVTGEDPVLFTHDDLAYLVEDGRAPWFSFFLQETMKAAPKWAAGLPLSVEGGYAQSYGHCK